MKNRYILCICQCQRSCGYIVTDITAEIKSWPDVRKVGIHRLKYFVSLVQQHGDMVKYICQKSAEFLKIYSRYSNQVLKKTFPHRSNSQQYTSIRRIYYSRKCCYFQDLRKYVHKIISPCHCNITNIICFDCTAISCIALTNTLQTGGRLNKKDGLTRYGNSHVKDKTS